MSLFMGDPDMGIRHVEQVIPLLEQMDDAALQHSASLWLVANQGPQSVTLIRDILTREIEWARAHASPYLAFDIGILSAFLLDWNELELAEKIALEGLAVCRAADDISGVAQLLLLQAGIDLARGNDAGARAYVEQGIAQSREADEHVLLADGLVELSTVALRQRDDACVSASVKEAIQLFRHIRNAERTAQCICIAAGLAHLRGQRERAARLLAVSQAHYESKVTERLSFYAEYELRFAALRSEMSPADFDHAWATGKQMTLKDAVAEVLSM
jgi:hypothetical protein